MESHAHSQTVLYNPCAYLDVFATQVLGQVPILRDLLPMAGLSLPQSDFKINLLTFG